VTTIRKNVKEKLFYTAERYTRYLKKMWISMKVKKCVFAFCMDSIDLTEVPDKQISAI